MTLPAHAGNAISRFSLPIYIISLLCIMLPPMDQALTLLQLGPVTPSSAEWRFRLIGMVSGAMLFPLIGVLMALLTAFITGNRLLFRVFMAVPIIAMIGLILALGLFVLDALQVRAEVPENRQRPFDVIVAKNVLQQIVQLVRTAVKEHVPLMEALQQLRASGMHALPTPDAISAGR